MRLFSFDNTTKISKSNINMSNLEKDPINTTTTKPTFHTSGEPARQHQLTGNNHGSTSTSYLLEYYDKIKTIVKKRHIIIFFFIIISLQLISDNITKYYPGLTVFYIPLVPGIYQVISGSMTYYEYIVGGIIASCVAYGLVFLLYNKLQTHFQRILFQSISVFIVVICMVLFSAISAPSLAYSLTALSLYPKMKFNYITTYVFALFVTAFLVWLYFYVYTETIGSSNINL